MIHVIYGSMSEPQHRTAPAPTGFSVKFPTDVAEILHDTAWRTGQTKFDLVCDAIRAVYGRPEPEGQAAS